METIWKITELKRQATDGMVTVAHYEVIATDGDFSERVYGTIGLEPGDTFIPSENLTERDVISWIKAKLDPAAIEQALAAQIDAQKNPPIVPGVPWA